MAEGASAAREAWIREEGRGRDARRVRDIPLAGWKDILWRTKDEIGKDRVSLVAAGVAFYLLLAIFPGLAALVSIYGIVADPQAIQGQLAALSELVPGGALEIIQSQVTHLAQQDQAALSFGFVFSLLLALWSASKGVQALFQGMNVAYEEEEKRGFIRFYLTTFAFTLGAILLIVLFIGAVAVVPLVLAFAGLGDFAEWAIRILRWVLVFVVAAGAVAVLQLYGPSRRRAKWRWVTWGSMITVVVWLVTAIAFSWYLANFANYNETYGSLGAAIGFLMWLWVSVFVLLAGAELNSEIEHQTAEDSTTGRDRPLGERGATMADTVGAAVAKQG
ncbi:MAG TPA: YihY/virulence factor BrkB family protein [Afifellaceae bacterium]|nr:YihY/virulence factor BrkB family protein [Afifellaceae bacterium]